MMNEPDTTDPLDAAFEESGWGDNDGLDGDDGAAGFMESSSLVGWLHPTN